MYTGSQYTYGAEDENDRLLACGGGGRESKGAEGGERERGAISSTKRVREPGGSVAGVTDVGHARERAGERTGSLPE